MNAFDFREQLDRPPPHLIVGDDSDHDDDQADAGGGWLGWAGQTRMLRDQLAELWSEVRRSPATHAVAAGTGLAFGTVATAGLAWVWSLFL